MAKYRVWNARTGKWVYLREDQLGNFPKAVLYSRDEDGNRVELGTVEENNFTGTAPVTAETVEVSEDTAPTYEEMLRDLIGRKGTLTYDYGLNADLDKVLSATSENYNSDEVRKARANINAYLDSLYTRPSRREDIYNRFGLSSSGEPYSAPFDYMKRSEENYDNIRGQYARTRDYYLHNALRSRFGSNMAGYYGDEMGIGNFQTRDLEDLENPGARYGLRPLYPTIVERAKFDPVDVRDWEIENTPRLDWRGIYRFDRTQGDEGLIRNIERRARNEVEWMQDRDIFYDYPRDPEEYNQMYDFVVDRMIRDSSAEYAFNAVRGGGADRSDYSKILTEEQNRLYDIWTQRNAQVRESPEPQRVYKYNESGSGDPFTPPAGIPVGIDRYDNLNRSEYINLKSDAVNYDDLHPEMKYRVNNFAKLVQSETGQPLLMTEGHRNYAAQEAIYKQGNAATPGRSPHGFGIATDFRYYGDGGLQQIVRNAVKNNPELLAKYNVKNADQLVDVWAEQSGLERNLYKMGRPREEQHFQMIEDEDFQNYVDMKKILDERMRLLSGRNPGSAYLLTVR